MGSRRIDPIFVDAIACLQDYAAVRQVSASSGQAFRALIDRADMALNGQLKKRNDLSAFTIKSIMGSGSYGKVYKATRTSNGEVVAIKRLKFCRPVEDFQERDIMIALKSGKNLLHLTEAFFDTTVNLVMPIMLCRLKDVTKIITKEVAKIYTMQLFGALKYMHKLEIIHCDIKPSNIMVDPDYNLQLGDFGASMHMKQKCSLDNQECRGTAAYWSPEVFERNNYSSKSDVWAMGVSIFEMLVPEESLFGDNTQMISTGEIRARVCSRSYCTKQIERIPHKCFRRELSKVLEISGDLRPTARSFLKQSTFLKELKISPDTLNHQPIKRLLRKPLPTLLESTYKKPVVNEKPDVVRKILYAGFYYSSLDQPEHDGDGLLGETSEGLSHANDFRAEKSNIFKRGSNHNSSRKDYQKSVKGKSRCVVEIVAVSRKKTPTVIKKKNQKKYTCKLCGTAFTLNKNLTRHEKSTHGTQVLTCGKDGCQLKFKRFDYLQAHIISKHHKKSFWKCAGCSKEFFSRQNLHYHMKVKKCAKTNVRQ